MAQQPEWYACEDCYGTGSVSAMFGGGECGCFNGRRPANEAAEEVMRGHERKFQEAIWAQAERDVED